MTADDMSCADLNEAAADSTHLDVLAVKVSVPLLDYLAYRVCRSNESYVIIVFVGEEKVCGYLAAVVNLL